MRKLLFCISLFFAGCFLSKAQTPFPAIDVEHYKFVIRLSDANDTIKGQARVRIKFLKDVESFQLNLTKTNAKGLGMLVSNVNEDGRNLSFSQDSDILNILAKATSNSVHSYEITYQGIPSDGLIISANKFGHRTFFGDNWANRAHNWLPCADYPADKATVDFFVTAPDHYQVVANGLKTEEATLPNHFKLTHYRETAPIPMKVMVIGVADFAIDHTGNVGKIPVYTYVFPENKDAGFKSYAVAKEILPFYIKMFGAYAYEKLANVQSKTIYGGMENAGAIFYEENSVTSRGIEELMAHEIAHQWFGDGVTEKDFSNLWLSEGFATYMTNVYLENKYGADTLKKRLTRDRSTVIRFEKRRFTPVVDTTHTTDYTTLLNRNAYEKGGWVLHMLRRKLGDDAFWKGIRAYYAQYGGSNANTDDLQKVMETASGQSLDVFFKQWLHTAGHPQLGITWKYDAAKQAVELNIVQKQDYLYDFPLEITIAGQLHTISIKDINTAVRFPATTKPSTIVVDPNVNLLATFDVAKGN